MVAILLMKEALLLVEDFGVVIILLMVLQLDLKLLELAQ